MFRQGKTFIKTAKLQNKADQNDSDFTKKKVPYHFINMTFSQPDIMLQYT